MVRPRRRRTPLPYAEPPLPLVEVFGAAHLLACATLTARGEVFGTPDREEQELLMLV